MAIVFNLLIMLTRGISGAVIAGVALTLMLLALVRKESSLMVFAALFTLPLAYAMGAWAGILLVVRLLPLFPLLSAFAISRDESIFAWILPLPTFGYLVYFLFDLVVSDFSGF